jgi:hypothetical protein
MKENELRIGNYVNKKINLYSNHLDYEEIVCTITDLCFIERNENVYLPIPLTEEWLIKFGFEKINHIYDGIIFLINKIKLCITLNGKCEIRGGYIPIKIQYVHQLQNLYFALTGEELQAI